MIVGGSATLFTTTGIINNDHALASFQTSGGQYFILDI